MKSLLKRLLPTAVLTALRDVVAVPASSRLTYLRFLFGRRARAMARLRRARQLPANPQVVMLCHGNIYRSPFAAAVLREIAARRPDAPMRVSSAGLLGRGGRVAPDDARAVAARLGYSLDAHTSEELTEEAARAADLLVVMDRRNEAVLVSRFPWASAKALSLAVLDPLEDQRGTSIEDPYGKGEAAVAYAYARIARCVARLHDVIAQGAAAVPQVPWTKRLGRRAVMAPALAPLWLRLTRDSAAVLMLHRFEDREAGTPGHSPEVLAAHLEYLRKHDYQIEPLDVLVERMLCGEPPRPRSVAITIDDGYRDFVRVGVPVLAQYDCPATLFLVTGFVDGECWLWYDAVQYLMGDAAQGDVRFAVGEVEERVMWRTPAERHERTWALIERLKRVPDAVLRTSLASLSSATGITLPAVPPARFAPLTWDEVRAWGQRGMTFGAHSRTHPILSNATDDQVTREITESWGRVRAMTTATSSVFAYPNGLPIDFGARERAAVLAAGLPAAVASVGGHCTLEHVRRDRFALPRIPYSDDEVDVRQSLAGVDRAKRFVRGTRA